jgi:hypothetical protein
MVTGVVCAWVDHIISEREAARDCPPPCSPTHAAEACEGLLHSLDPRSDDVVAARHEHLELSPPASPPAAAAAAAPGRS